MARRRESLSFEPTQAIYEDKENIPAGIESGIADHQISRGRTTKEVHFSPVMSPPPRAQSIATTVPLLQPVSSASQLPRRSNTTKSGSSSFDMEAYAHMRAVMQEQRSVFAGHLAAWEKERKHIDRERKLWETERELLQSRITELESALNKNTSGRRRYSNDSTRSMVPSLRSVSGFSHFASHSNSVNGSRQTSESHTAPPVWEPEQPKPASRVFSESDMAAINVFGQGENNKPNGHLPSISEDAMLPALEREISPSTVPSSQHSEPVPVEKIDPKLDGIVLKSTALQPSFQFMSPKVLTPQPQTPQRSPSPESKSNGLGAALHLPMDGMISPFDAKLKMHAGHTPMAFTGNGPTGPMSGQSPDAPSPKQEKPPTPVQTAKRPPPRPTERSDSYFSATADDDASTEKMADVETAEDEDQDPELKGPLTMSSNNEKGQSDAFLNTLNMKLLAEAHKHIKSPESSTSDEKNRETKPPQDARDDDGGPRLRLKKSMNFGSAFGSNKCGGF